MTANPPAITSFIPRVFAALIALAALATPAPAQTGIATVSPEPVVREFLRAFFAGDSEALHRVVDPHQATSRLLAARARSPEEAAAIAEDAQAIRIEPVQEYRFEGKTLDAPPPGSGWPVGTTARFMAPFRGSLLVVSTVRRQDGWKIDLRWWAAEVALMEREAPPPEDSPEFAARSLVAAMLDLDREAAAQFLVPGGPGGDIERLFAGAPPYREPSGHLMALVAEMPLVEAGPDDYARMPSGRIVRGGTTADTRLLVGIYGMFEMPFQLRRIDGRWRVEAEPYFAILNR